MTLQARAAAPRSGRHTDRIAARHERLMGLGAAAATLLLLGGPPTALSVSVGWPLPHQLPTMDELHTFLLTPLSDQTILKVLATIGWLLWTQLAGAVLLELTAQLRGLSAPRLPLMTLNQQLAHRLISATLLLLPTSQPLLASGPLPAYTRAVAVHPYPEHGVAPPSPPLLRTSLAAEQPAVIEPTMAAAAVSEIDAGPPDATSARASGITPATTLPVRAGVAALKQYTVHPPEGRHHDSLWGIAARHLGDGRRFPEIFTLNQGRPQPDGGTLTKPSLIRPGWVLLLPADATGTEVQPAVTTPEHPAGLHEHHPSAPTDATAAPNIAPNAAPDAAVGTPLGPIIAAPPAAPVDRATSPAPSTDRGQRQPSPAAHEDAGKHQDAYAEDILQVLSLGLGAVAALAALTRARKAAQRRRRLGRRLPPPPPQLRPVETALRREAQQHQAIAAEIRGACALAAATAPLNRPDVVLAVLRHDDHRLELLTDPRSTRSPVTPVPFTATDRGWQLAAADRGFLAAADAQPDPLPVLLPVGRLDRTRHDDRAQLFVDLTRLGLVSLAGPGPDDDSYCLTAAGELAGAPWAGLTRVLVPTGLAAQLGDLERVEPVSDLTGRAPQLLDYARTATLTGDIDAADQPDGEAAAGEAVPNGPSDDRADRADSTLRMVLIGWPAEQLSDELVDAALDPSQPLIIVTSSPHPRAAETWQLQDGTLSGVLGHWQVEVPGRSPQAAEVPELLRHSTATDLPSDDAALQDLRDDSPPQPPVEPAASGTATVTREPEATGEPADPVAPIDLPDGSADGQPRTVLPAVPVEIGLLGPVQLIGAEAPRRLPVLQILVYLAVHRRGASAEQLATALWPDTRVASQTLRNRVAEARALVGGKVSGGPGWRLDPSIGSDWQQFQHLATGDSSSQQRALELVRGLPFEDFPDAEWIDTEGLRSQIESAIVDLALQYGADALADGQPGQAFWAARAGLRASPYEERLFRLAMRAADAEGATGKVRALMRELRSVLDLELEPDDTIQPETLSLYRELLDQPRPGTD